MVSCDAAGAHEACKPSTTAWMQSTGDTQSRLAFLSFLETHAVYHTALCFICDGSGWRSQVHASGCQSCQVCAREPCMQKPGVMRALSTDSCCATAQSFGALPGFPSGSLNDFFAQQPSSSADQTLAHELLGLPTMSQGFSAKVHHSSPSNHLTCVTCRLWCGALPG